MNGDIRRGLRELGIAAIVGLAACVLGVLANHAKDGLEVGGLIFAIGAISALAKIVRALTPTKAESDQSADR